MKVTPPSFSLFRSDLLLCCLTEKSRAQTLKRTALFFHEEWITVMKTGHSNTCTTPDGVTGRNLLCYFFYENILGTKVI